jgi:hypothetical protein
MHLRRQCLLQYSIKRFQNSDVWLNNKNKIPANRKAQKRFDEPEPDPAYRSSTLTRANEGQT